MHWQVAVEKSKKGTATRVDEAIGMRKTTVRYRDGSGFIVTAKNGKVDFENSRQATSKDMDGYTDWFPS